MLDATDEFDGPTDDENQQLESAGETPQSEDGPDTDNPLADDQAAEDKPSNREARYRIQLREAEAERDQLAARVEALQRAEVERLAAKTIQKPSALWAAQTPLADLLADDGTVDPQKVAAAAKAAQQDLGLAATRSGAYVAREGTGIHQASGGNTWEDAFKA